MLSSVANRLYWAGRYLERSEDVARIVNAYTQFIMDTPKGNSTGWDALIDIIDGQQAYFSRYKRVNEANVVKFMLMDPENPGSVSESVRWARENMRTTRDVMPEEAWELMNELNLFVKQQGESAIRRRDRYHFLEEVMLRNMQLDGLFDGTMNRDRSFQYIRLGRYLERCDMTTRVVDVGTAALPDEDLLPAVEISLWSSLLTSLSATSAYRRHVGPVVDPAEVIDFVFNYDQFPRSIRYSLQRIERVLEGFTNADGSLLILGSIYKKLDRFNPSKASKQQVHQLIDKIQLELAQLNTTIADTWFFPDK